MNPVVGITVCIDAGQRLKAGVDYLYLRRAYAEALAAAGATPVLLSPEAPAADCLTLCSALVISGGGDLPRRLNDSVAEAPLGEAEHPARITWERDLLATFARERKPVLGVCYGMQLMNIHFGGSLFRDVAGEVADALDHGGQGRSLEHEITRSEDSTLLRDLPLRFLANSSHGQAVHEVAPGFAVSARGGDGVIEAIENASERLFGVEWHPESDATGGPVYRRFVALIRG